MFRVSLIGAAFAATALAPAQATVITIDQGAAYSANYDNGSMGSGRGFGLVADESFSISSVGFDLSVPTANDVMYTIEIFASTTGSDVGALLASTQFLLPQGDGYFDQALNFLFDAGSAYVVNFSRVDGSPLEDLGTHYAWEGAVVDYGPFRIVEGFEGAAPSNYNPLIPYARVNVGPINSAVPEPGTWAMMLMGFGATGFALRRRRAPALAEA